MSNPSTITPSQAAQRINNGGAGRLIDVRTPIEFAAVHATGARNIPLDRLDPKALPVGDGDHPLYLICKSGSRAQAACQRLCEAGLVNVAVVSGGTDAWVRDGLPVERREVMSLERQVRVGAGLLVLIGVVLGIWLNPWWLAIAAFVGAGLVFAGVTNFCGMALILAKAPWNRMGFRTSCEM